MFYFIILLYSRGGPRATATAEKKVNSSREQQQHGKKQIAAGTPTTAVPPITAVKPATEGTPGLLETPVAEGKSLLTAESLVIERIPVKKKQQ
jgi:hypothetical protein